MNERDLWRLQHMLDYAERAMRSLGDQPYDAFIEDEKTKLAVERAVEIVGESASKVSDEAKSGIDLSWPAITYTRHVLAHAYDTIDYRIIYDVVKLELPKVISALRHALGDKAE
jgi:uncharacterized protein with HEPN domain